MNATMKRAENKTVRTLLTGLKVQGEETANFTDLRVSHGRGTASGWLEVEVSINTPTDCYCDEVERNMGRCKNCSDKWFVNYHYLNAEVQKQTGRRGEYNGNISMSIQII